MFKGFHGTIRRYTSGCRCVFCEQAFFRYQRNAYDCNKKTIPIPKIKRKGDK